MIITHVRTRLGIWEKENTIKEAVHDAPYKSLFVIRSYGISSGRVKAYKNVLDLLLNTKLHDDSRFMLMAKRQYLALIERHKKDGKTSDYDLLMESYYGAVAETYNEIIEMTKQELS